MKKQNRPEQLRDSRFINNLKAKHYIIFPSDLLFGYPELTPQEKHFYAILVHYGNISVANGNVTEDGRPVVYPSQRRLAQEIELSQPTISRYIKKLAKSGLVKVNEQGTGKHNWLTLYTPNEVPDEVPEKPTNVVDDIIQKNLARKPKPRPNRPKREPLPDRRSSKDMANYFAERYEARSGRKPPLMTGKEFKLFKDLIEYYGYDKVVQFVDFTVDHYDAMRRDNRLTGPPTVGIIWGFRAYLEEKVDQYYGQQKEAAPAASPDEGTGSGSAW